MTIILFLVDTSASMCQKAYVNGVQKSYLDIAKGAVETFLKYRQRSQDCMGDRYMLLTFEDPPSNVKAGWKENHATFMNELKNLQSTGLTSMGEALRNAFDLLNLNRMQSGIDTYGQGRCPFYLEPSVIIVITDGGKYSFKNGVHQEIILPLNTQTTGTKLTKEPFRWDQRLFSLVLRMAGNKIDERVEGKVPHDDSPIEKMCEVTGGRSYRVKSHFVLNQCIESLVQKVQPGVVVHFEQLMPKDTSECQDFQFGSSKKMIYVQKHPTQKTFPVGFWPIPEPYWPDPKANNLPPRDAHPKIRIVSPCVEEPPMIPRFPVDKYEVEPSPLTLQILSKREPTKCWPVFVSNGIHSLEMPFGYLKASPNFSQVHLLILPYNYLTLLPLLSDLYKCGLNPQSDWVYKFSAYVRSIPQYYGPFLRRALVSANVPFQLLQYILPENLDSYLSPAVANYLKTMKNTAKQEQENMCLRVFKQLKLQKPPFHQVETTKLNCGLTLKRDLVSHPQLKDTFAKIHGEINLYENYTIIVPTQLQQSSAKNYRNPFDIPRRDLIDEISRMRENFFKLPTSGINLFTKDAGHCLPISEMGNYQEYLKNKQSPLREIEPTNVRQHMFGNPYKKDKHMVMVDEADLGDVAPMKPQPNSQNMINNQSTTLLSMKKTDATSIRSARKRKAGPIRKDYVFQRQASSYYQESGSSSSNSGGSSVGSMSPQSTSSSMDIDDTQSITSETSSTLSDDDDNVLVIDFNDEPLEDTYLNGHVQDFINGNVEDTEDTSVISTAATMTVSTAAISPQSTRGTGGTTSLLTNSFQTPAISNNTTTSLLSNFIVPQPPITQPPPISVLFSSSPSSLTANLNPITMTTLSQSSIPTTTTTSSSVLTNSTIPTAAVTAAAAATSATISSTPATAAISTNSLPFSTHHNNGGSSSNSANTNSSNSGSTNNISSQNDYEAQEISKILQQCTNGMDQQRLHTNRDDHKETNNYRSNLTNQSHHHHHHHHVNEPSSPPHPPPPLSTISNEPIGTNNNTTTNGNNFIEMNNTTTAATTIASATPTTISTLTSPNNAAATPTPTPTTTATTIHKNNNNNIMAPTPSLPPPISSSVPQRNSVENNNIKIENETIDIDEEDEEQKENIKLNNKEARGVIFKDIRKPGRDYSQLLDHLSLVKGSLETRFLFVQMCISESLRFRRKKMADSIQEWWDKQIDHINLAKTSQT